jgi:hypothetical protein
MCSMPHSLDQPHGVTANAKFGDGQNSIRRGLCSKNRATVGVSCATKPESDKRCVTVKAKCGVCQHS